MAYVQSNSIFKNPTSYQSALAKHGWNFLSSECPFMLTDTSHRFLLGLFMPVNLRSQAANSLVPAGVQVKLCPSDHLPLSPPPTRTRFVAQHLINASCCKY